MLTEQVLALHNVPKPPPVKQGQDTYPRVVDQRRHGERHQLVTFALPGLKRACVRVPESVWLEGHHLAVSGALLASMSRLLPPLDLSDEPTDHSDI